MSFLIVIEFADASTPSGIWFLPLALGLMLIGGNRKYAGAALLALGLTACGGGSASSNGGGDLAAESVQLNVTSVQSRGDTSGGSGIVDGLPANGSVITLNQ